jgi:hypothetical protein
MLFTNIKREGEVVKQVDGWMKGSKKRGYGFCQIKQL